MKYVINVHLDFSSEKKLELVKMVTQVTNSHKEFFSTEQIQYIISYCSTIPITLTFKLTFVEFKMP